MKKKKAVNKKAKKKPAKKRIAKKRMAVKKVAKKRKAVKRSAKKKKAVKRKAIKKKAVKRKPVTKKKAVKKKKVVKKKIVKKKSVKKKAAVKKPVKKGKVAKRRFARKKKLSPGIHRIHSEEYHGDPCIKPSLSRGIIKEILACPAKAFVAHPRLNPDFVTPAPDRKFDVGTAAHSLLLEGVNNCVVIKADDWRTKESRETADEARYIGKTPLLENQFDKTIVMVEAAEKQIIACPDLDIKNLQKDGKSEQTIIWKETDEIHRVSYHRIRLDWASKDFKITLDYKSTGGSADPNEFTNHIFKMGYDVQHSYYTRGILAATEVTTTFIFVVQETEPPYLCSFIGLTPQYVDMGKQKVEFGIFLWNQCMQTGEWTGYPKKICYVEPPAWALTAWEIKASEITVL